jgi:hypothetical protein
MNDTTISINYDGGSTLGSATLSSTLNNDAYRKVAIIFERSVLDVSVDGEHVFHFADSQLRDRVYDNNSGYVTFTHSSTDERKLKNLKFTNGDKWVREIDSSNIAYVGGNVGIGTTIPGTKLDVSGTVRGTHLMGDGSAISAIQSSNVSDFGSNVTRIGTLETDLGDNSSRITNLSSNLSDNSSRITALESGDISISGDKTFTGDIIFESNIHMNGGNVLVANTVNMSVSDPIIELGLNNIGTNDLGIIMSRPAANSNVAVVFDESDDILRMGYTLNGASDSIVDLDSNALAVSVQGALSAGSNLEVGTANLFVDTSTSRVGIGMSNPSYTLDVDGDINLSTGSTLKINGTDAVFSNWTANGSDIYRSSGNVGIGVAPSYTLDVDGDINLSTGSTLKINGTDAVFSNWTVSGSDIYRSSGNVGIGTNSPATKLNMKGGVFLAENQASTNTQILYYDGGGTGGNNNSYTIANEKFGTGVFVNDTGTTGSTITLVNKESASNTTKHASIGFVNTDTTANGKFGGQIGFWPEDSNASKQQVRIYTSGTSAGYNLPVQRMVVTGDGNVGIGTTSPGAKLDVNGNIGATHVSLGTTRYPTLGGNWLTIFSPTYNGAIGNNHPDPDGGILFTNQSSGGAFPWGYYMGVVKDVASTNGTTQRFDIGKSNDLNTSDYTSGADTLTPYLTIDNGNVGIGTTNPTHQLHIGPKDNDHIYLASSNNSYGWTIDTDDQGSGTVPFRIIKRTDGVDSTVLTIKNQDGKVGIGTTSPSTLLDVVGHPHTFIRKMAQAGTATNDYNHILGGPRPGTTSAGAVHFINGSARTSDGGTDTYTIRNDSGKLRLGNASFDTLLEGNVGIGVTSPSVALDISGQLNVSAGLKTIQLFNSNLTVSAGAWNDIGDFSGMSNGCYLLTVRWGNSSNPLVYWYGGASGVIYMRGDANASYSSQAGEDLRLNHWYHYRTVGEFEFILDSDQASGNYGNTTLWVKSAASTTINFTTHMTPLHIV